MNRRAQKLDFLIFFMADEHIKSAQPLKPVLEPSKVRCMDRPIDNTNSFGPSDAGDNPMALFTQWHSAAHAVDPRNASNVTLSTAYNNRPSSRVVLLKEFGGDGFVFYTNTNSRKGLELAENPWASMLFWWPDSERQVRIEGCIAPISAAQSDAYFATRPRESQLSAWSSPQSSEIDAPVSLDLAKQKFKDDPIPRPCSWGGYRLVAERFEFWQGQANRLHDRVLFKRIDNAWRRSRLAP